MSDLWMTVRGLLSGTVAADLVEASRAAVEAGGAESMSAWVNDALRLKVEHDRRLRALDEFIAGYEAEYGEITEDEMAEAARGARERAVVVAAIRGALTAPGLPDAGPGCGRGRRRWARGPPWRGPCGARAAFR